MSPAVPYGAVGRDTVVYITKPGESGLRTLKASGGSGVNGPRGTVVSTQT